MQVIIAIFMFILGSVLGSFFHVVGSRLSEEGGSLLYPERSYCPHCGHVLQWYELIPLVSYLLQGGKCRNCHYHISISYFAIELFTGVLYTISYLSFGFSLELGVALVISSLLMIISVSDFTYLIIPDEVLIVAGILLILLNFGIYGFVESLLRIGSGLLLFIIMYGLMKLGNFMFKTESLGGGDVKLMFIVGLVVEPILGLFVLFIASFIALPLSLILYVLNQERAIPFGPFIVVSLLFVFFLKIDLNRLMTWFQWLVYTV